MDTNELNALFGIEDEAQEGVVDPEVDATDEGPEEKSSLQRIPERKSQPLSSQRRQITCLQSSVKILNSR